MRNRLTSVQAKGESKEKTLEQQLEEMQSRRDLIKEKNNKIAELTEQMEKNKREFGEEELKHIKVSNEQEAEISRLRAKVAAVETELRSIRSNKSQQSKKEE